DPHDVVALRALRREAIVRGAWMEAVTLLEKEVALPLSTEDRRLALLALAEIRLGSLRDADAAEQAARVALGLKRTSVAAAMLLAEGCFAQGKQTEGILALERVVDAWQDSAARAIVLVDIARIIERQGHSKRAHQYYSRAAEVDSNALDAHLGMARTARR